MADGLGVDEALPAVVRRPWRRLRDAVAGLGPVPTYTHLPLVTGPDGRRLAKRHGDTRLAALRAASVPPQRLLGLLAWSCGLRPTREPVTAAELLDGFDLAAIPREPFVLSNALWRELFS